MTISSRWYIDAEESKKYDFYKDLNRQLKALTHPDGIAPIIAAAIKNAGEHLDFRGRLLRRFDLSLERFIITEINQLDLQPILNAFALNPRIRSISLNVALFKHNRERLTWFFTTHPSITTLTLYDCDHSQDFEQLPQFVQEATTLRKISLSNVIFKKKAVSNICQALEHNKSISSISFPENKLRIKDVHQIASILRLSAHITSLDFQWSRLNHTKVSIITQALQENSSLKTLLLTKSKLYNKGLRSIAELLKINSTLETLILKDCEARGKGLEALYESLKVNQTLRKLALADNELGLLGAVSLGKALLINSSITKLNLEETYFGEEGAIIIASALKINATLTHLNLKSNKLGDKFAVELEGSLSANTTLKSLNLGLIRIGDSGTASLSRLLASNTSLKTLKMKINVKKMSVENFGKIYKGLESNTGLIQFALETNKISDHGLTSVSQAIAANTTLKVLNLGRRLELNLNQSMQLGQSLKFNPSLQFINAIFEESQYPLVQDTLERNIHNEEFKSSTLFGTLLNQLQEEMGNGASCSTDTSTAPNCITQ